MKTKFKLLIALLLVGTLALPQEGFSQSFNKNSLTWYPWESADYNEAFRRAFLDLEAFVESGVVIGNKWTIANISFPYKGDAVWTETVSIPGPHLEDTYEMIQWYIDLANAPNSSYSAEYKRGLEDGATAFSSLPYAL